jgi:hypothetical protein
MYIHVCYIYLQPSWFLRQMLVNIPYMEHMGYKSFRVEKKLLTCSKWSGNSSKGTRYIEVLDDRRGRHGLAMLNFATFTWQDTQQDTDFRGCVHAKISGQLGKKRWSTHKSVMFSDDKQMIKQISRWHWLGLGLFQWGLPRTGSSLSKGRHVQRSDSSQVVSRL